MNKKESTSIKILLKSNDFDFVKQGLFLWENLDLDFFQFLYSLRLVTNREKPDLYKTKDLLNLHKLHSACAEFKYSKYIALWILGHLASFKQMKKQNKKLILLRVSGINMASSDGSLTTRSGLQPRSCIKLQCLPENFVNLQALKSLDLSSQAFQHFPLQLEKLKKLERLNLRKNHLKQLPDEFEISPSLQVLILANNQLSSLPEWLFKLDNLKVLNLNANKLSFVPKKIGNLNKLECLGLSSNNLVRLPPNFGDLNKLKILGLKNNNIKHLPKTFEKLTALWLLDLGRNPLVLSIQTICNLSKLFFLDLNRCFSVPSIKTIEDTLDLTQIPLKDSYYLEESYSFRGTEQKEESLSPQIRQSMIKYFILDTI